MLKLIPFFEWLIGWMHKLLKASSLRVEQLDAQIVEGLFPSGRAAGCTKSWKLKQ